MLFKKLAAAVIALSMIAGNAGAFAQGADPDSGEARARGDNDRMVVKRPKPVAKARAPKRSSQGSTTKK